MAGALDVIASALGGIHEDLRCELKIAGLDPGKLKVASFQSTEGLSRLFAYTIVVASDVGDVAALEETLGLEAAFGVLRGGRLERVVHGVVSEVVPDGVLPAKRVARTTMVLEPRLGNLRYSGGFRIFQNVTIKDIVEELVKPEQITVDWRVRPEPPQREYRTQQDESDYAFISRLASDEGLSFFFEHTAEKTTLVFTNNARGFGDPDPKKTLSLDFNDTEGAVTLEHVRSIRRSQRVRTGAFEHRDFDFTNPRVPLLGRAETDKPDAEATTTRREVRDYPGGFDDKDHAEQADGRARMRLEELRTDAFTLTGTASTMRLKAGAQLTLSGHPDARFNRKLTVTEVEVGAFVAAAFAEAGSGGGGRASSALASFHAVPADHPIRPPRRPKPASRLQTARVVGPTEGDPFVDDFGRVKVQFAWDRDHKFDEHSSCFIRMMTPVAHGNEGWYSAHKVGSEVLVDFIDGDIDRPVVLGALYNAVEKQPYKLKDEVAKSSWKVRSIPGGKGFNEFTFDNTAGKENILLHAQKNLTEKVLSSHSESIGADQTTFVGNNQSTTVKKDRSLIVKGYDHTEVEKDRSESVTGDETVSIMKARNHVVGGDDGDTLTVTNGPLQVNVNNKDYLTSVPNGLTQIDSKEMQLHAQKQLRAFGDEQVALTQGKAKCVMEKDSIHLETPSVVVELKGNQLSIQADDGVSLKCGSTTLTLTKSEIKLSSQKISLIVGSSTVVVDSSAVKVTAAEVDLNA